MLEKKEYLKLFLINRQCAFIDGDFNAYSYVFGAERTDERGQLLEDLIEDFNCIAFNTGAGTSVRRTGEQIHLGIAMASINVRINSQWMVLDETLMVIDNRPALEESTRPRWAYRRTNWNGFKADCKRLLNDKLITDDVTSSRERMVNCIIEAAERHMVIIKPSNNPAREPVPYWTDECTHSVKLRNKAKNKIQRTRDLDDRDEYYRLKDVAERTIKTAKKTYGRDHVSKLDDKSKIGRVWRTVKMMIGVRASPSIKTITHNGVVYDTDRS